MARTFPRPRRAPRLLLLLLVLGVALAWRLWRIESIPPGFHFDESFEGLEAWRILTIPSYKPIFLEGNFGVPPLNAYANAVTFWVGGLFGVAPGPTLMRITAALFGVLGVLAVYGAAVELRLLDARGRLSSAFPLLAAGVLAIMRWHIHFSRMGIEPIIVPLEWAAAVWLLLPRPAYGRMGLVCGPCDRARCHALHLSGCVGHPILDWADGVTPALAGGY